jgi:CheY-like chemotaxis protein
MQTKINDRSLKKNSNNRWSALVVDDNAAIRRAVGKALRVLGGEITTACNGAEAVEIVQLVQKAGLRFDLILIDVQMPVMSGIEATRRMRATGFDGPIIVISAAEESDIRDMCLAAGCDEFIRKPITLESLTTIVRRYCQSCKVDSCQTHCVSPSAPIAMTIG